MESDWTPIQRAGEKGAPFDWGKRQSIVRRLQDGLLASRAKLVVTVYRPKIYPETSHIDDKLAAALAGNYFTWGEPVEDRESNVELPASLWTADKLGRPELEHWTSGEERLNIRFSIAHDYEGDRATFYGIELSDPLRQLAQSSQPNVLSKIGAERECRDWLAIEFDADPNKHRTKDHFRKAALSRFAGRLSARGFDDRVWPALAQPHGRSAPGAKKKS